MDGRARAVAVSPSGTQEERDRAGPCSPSCTSAGPQRAGLLHADPHPGNFRMLADGRLGVIDFGATARLPDGHPEPIGRLLRWRWPGKPTRSWTTCGPRGSCGPTWRSTPRGCSTTCGRYSSRSRPTRFHFTRAWMQEQAARIADPRTEASRLGRQLNLPPAYLLIHRVTIGSIGVLCQLGASGDFRASWRRAARLRGVNRLQRSAAESRDVDR